MAGGKVSRRAFIGGAGAAAVALSGAGSPVGAAFAAGGGDAGPFRGELPDGTAVVSGLVDRVVPPASLLLQGSPTVEIALSDGAQLWRDRTVTLEDFRTGDSVSALGRPVGETSFVADVLEPMYYNVSGIVQSVTAGIVTTSGGAFRLSGSTQVLQSSGGTRPLEASDLRLGRSIQVIARREAGDPSLVAVRVVANA